jgi:hypothetical protein
MMKTILTLCAIALWAGSFVVVCHSGVRAEDLPTFELVLENNVFTPADLRVPANTAFRLKVLNKEKAGAEIESKDLKIEKVVAAGGEILARVRPMKPGRYLLVNEYREDIAKAFVVVE